MLIEKKTAGHFYLDGPNPVCRSYFADPTVSHTIERFLTKHADQKLLWISKFTKLKILARTPVSRCRGFFRKIKTNEVK